MLRACATMNHPVARHHYVHQWQQKADACRCWYCLQECIKVLAQLPQPSCPVANVVLQQYLGKILGHLKKQLQVSKGLSDGCGKRALMRSLVAAT